MENEDDRNHLLSVFEPWIKRDEVAGELSQLIDARPGAKLDLELLSREFKAAGRSVQYLDVDFESLVVKLARNFEEAAAAHKILRERIDTAALRTLVEEAVLARSDRRRIAERLKGDGEGRWQARPTFGPGPGGAARRLSPPDFS